jgi:hypothetical protein
MANALATHSVGKSLMTSLQNAYDAQNEITHPFAFRLISAGELAELAAPPRNALTLFLYRLAQNEQPRSNRAPGSPVNANPPLTLELHYLLTAWADSASMEQTVLTWAMREIQMHPVLDSSNLSLEGGWEASDVVQLVPANLTNDELAGVWRLLSPPYHLSVSYIARGVRIDTHS